MARITQAQAESVAIQLVEKIQKEINKEQKDQQEYITEIYKATIPKEILKVFTKYNEWMLTSNDVYVRGVGLKNNVCQSLTEYLPKNCGRYSSPAVDLTNEQADIYVNRKNKIDSLVSKKQNTREEIYNLLLSFTTWKKALAAMPELKPYAPQEGGNTGLMIVPQKTREKISCLISTTDNSCIEQL